MLDLPQADRLIVRRRDQGGAVFSECEKYRYLLWRWWGDGDPDPRVMVAFICLNPSTATESRNDPTVKRCITYARDWHFSGMFMLNIFALRSTDPSKLRLVDDPTGEANDTYLIWAYEQACLTVGAWGNHGGYRDRGDYVAALMPEIMHLHRTRHGHPGHPLYLKKDLRPQLWRGE